MIFRLRCIQGASLIELLVATLLITFIIAHTTATSLAQTNARKQLAYQQYALLIAEEVITRIRRNRLTSDAHTHYLNANWQSTNAADCRQRECASKELAHYDIAEVLAMIHAAIPDSHVGLTACEHLLCLAIYWQSDELAVACAEGQCVRLRFF